MSRSEEEKMSLQKSMADVREWQVQNQLEKESLQAELQRVSEDKEAAKEAATQAKTEMDRLHALKSRAVETRNRLKAKLAKRRGESEAHASSVLCKLESVIEDQSQQSAKLSGARDAFVKLVNEEAVGLQQQIEDAIDCIEGHMRRSASTRKEIAEAGDDVKRLKDERDMVSVERSQLRDTRDKLATKLSERRTQLQTILDETAKVEKGNEEKKMRLKEVQEEKEVLRRHLNIQIPTKEAELQCLSSELDTSKSKQAKLKAEISALVDQLNSVKSETESVNKNVIDMEQELKLKKEDLLAKEEVLNEVREDTVTRLSELEEFKRQQVSSLDEKINEVNAEKHKLDDLEAKNAKEIDDLRHKSFKLAEEKKEMEHTFALLKQLEQQDRQEEMAARQSQARQEAEEVQALKFKINSAELEILDLKDTLREKEKVLTTLGAEVFKAQRKSDEGRAAGKESSTQPDKNEVTSKKSSDVSAQPLDQGPSAQQTSAHSNINESNQGSNVALPVISRLPTQPSNASESDFSDFLARTSPSRWDTNKLINYSFFGSGKK